MSSPAHLRWLTVDANALRGNMGTIVRRCAPGTRVIAVVKANAYGHGMELVAKTLLRTPGLWGFGVANIAEGLRLRAAGIRTKILVLSYCEPELLRQGIAARLSLVVYDRTTFASMAREAKTLRTRVRVHVKVDTGTHRIGIDERRVFRLLRDVRENPHAHLEGVFSHLANAEDDLALTDTQIARFRAVSDAACLPNNVLRHIACSAAVFRSPHAGFDAVRSGIALYGLAPWPSGSVRVRLTPVLTWYARLLQVKTVPKGDGVGYGHTFRAKKETLLGILPIGYADGYDRRFSNNAFVLLRGVRCPVVGRVSMNLTIIDCTRVPSAKRGDTVVVLGRQGSYAVTAADLAERAKTLHYEFVTRIHPDLPRYLV